MTLLDVASLFAKDSQYIFSQNDFETISKLIYSESGNVLPPGKAMLVYSRLARRLRDRSLGSFSDYITLIKQDEQERRKAVALLTTNHTYFYREEHHFEHFQEHVRADLIARAKGGGNDPVLVGRMLQRRRSLFTRIHPARRGAQRGPATRATQVQISGKRPHRKRARNRQGRPVSESST